MPNPTLTIFTATYNRGYLIEKLYRSLQRQSVFDFEWLVVDDGSQDGTKVLFDQWCKEINPFPIRYYYQENSGLIRALNKGVILAEGRYLAKIDSDDYVTDDYARNILSWLKDLPLKEKVYAVGGLRVTPDGAPLKGIWPRIPGDYLDATDLERPRYDLDADMSEAWNLEILRKYPFPVWEGEKFAPEQIVFHQIALDGYKIRWYNVPVCICEYQEGGLTKGAGALEKQNPMGYAMMYNHKLKIPGTFIQRCKWAMQCNALCFVGGHAEYIMKSNALGLSILMLLPGWFLSFRRRRQYR